MFAVSGSPSSWTYTIAQTGDVEQYDGTGKLLSITDSTGNKRTLNYDLEGRLETVTDIPGHNLDFHYDSANRLTTLTDPAGGVITYTYDTAGNLSTVAYPDLTPADPTDNPIRIYHYEDSRYPHALTGITDENGDRFATYGYDDQGRATLSEHTGGAERVELVYYEDGSSTVTDALGTVRTRRFSTILDVVKGTGISQPGGAGSRHAQGLRPRGIAAHLAYIGARRVAFRLSV